MRPPRIVRTVSFRLAVLYALIFGASVIALAAAVYIISTTALDRQTRTRIQSEAIELRQEYRAGGLGQMLSVIRDRQRGRLVGGLDYTVYDAGGHRLFGSLPRSNFTPGWNSVVGPPDGDEPPGQLERLAVYAVPLDQGRWLMVGDDIGKVRQLGRVIMTTFAWALLGMITLAAAGGTALSVAFLGRVDAITRTAEAIIGGNIQRRIPLRGTNDEMDRLAGTLNRMLDRIGQLMDSLRQVSGDIAHDLRTPLGRLRQTLDEARRSARTSADYEAAFDRAISETDAILDTFSALLRIAQIEAGTRRAGFRPLDLSALAISIGQTYAPVAEDEGRSLLTSVEPGIRIEGDRELLAQMLVNLTENALRHAGAGAHIKIALEKMPSGAILRIADDGPGIPEAERGNVLKRFYRLERSRTTAGSGLGLSLVAAIVELHGSTIRILDNHPGLCVEIQFSGPLLPTPGEAADAGAVATGFRAAPELARAPADRA